MNAGQSANTAWTWGQYSVFRVVFGTWLAVHFAMLVPWGAELFAATGVLPDGHASPLLRLFPNVFLLDDSPAFVTGVLVAATALAVVFLFGWHDRTAALLLWFVQASMYGRNPLTGNPGLPYVGLLLLVHVGLPRAPHGGWVRHGQLEARRDWRVPRALHRVVWILMSTGYSYSGWMKLQSPSWCDGSALAKVLVNPLAHAEGLGPCLLAMPAWVLQGMTWGALALELGFVVFALSGRLRPFAWAAMLAMHCVLLLLIDFADLSLGMVMLHLFTCDPAWLPPRRAKGQTALEVHCDPASAIDQRWVRFLRAEAPTEDAFRFVAHGSAVADCAPKAALPRQVDPVAVLFALGGVWRAFGHAVALLPAWLRNAAVATARCGLRPLCRGAAVDCNSMG